MAEMKWTKEQQQVIDARGYPQIDLVTTPDGARVGMVHCNNCTSDINAWVNLFREFGEMYV